MTEKIIQTKRGVYGQFSITLPVSMKTAMLAWQQKSGMKKAEFLRLALTTGFLELCKGILAEDVNRLLTDAERDPSSWGPQGCKAGDAAQGRPPVSVSADGRPASHTDGGLS